MTAPFGGRRAVPPAVGSGGRDLAGGSSPRHDAGVAAPTRGVMLRHDRTEGWLEILGAVSSDP